MWNLRGKNNIKASGLSSGAFISPVASRYGSRDRACIARQRSPFPSGLLGRVGMVYELHGTGCGACCRLSRFKVFTLKTSKTCQLSLRPGLICKLRAPLWICTGLGPSSASLAPRIAAGVIFPPYPCIWGPLCMSLYWCSPFFWPTPRSGPYPRGEPWPGSGLCFPAAMCSCMRWLLPFFPLASLLVFFPLYRLPSGSILSCHAQDSNGAI